MAKPFKGVINIDILGSVPDWDPYTQPSCLTDAQRALHRARRCAVLGDGPVEVYAGFLSHADHEIGRLLGHLKDTGELDDTLIVLVSDNDASREADTADPMIVSWPEQITTAGVRSQYAETRYESCVSC